MPDSCKTVILEINELPVTLETLWFRLLGRGSVQQQAVKELSHFAYFQSDTYGKLRDRLW